MALHAIIDGALGSDPDIHFTQQGKAVTNLSIGCTASVKDENGQWQADGEPVWVRVTLWEDEAQTAANLLNKGMRVHAEGILVKRAWQDKNGQCRISDELKHAKVWPHLSALDAPQSSQAPASRDFSPQGRKGYQPAPQTSQNGAYGVEEPPPPF